MKVRLQSRTATDKSKFLCSWHNPYHWLGMQNAVYTHQDICMYTTYFLQKEITNFCSRQQTWHCLNNSISLHSKAMSLCSSGTYPWLFPVVHIMGRRAVDIRISACYFILKDAWELVKRCYSIINGTLLCILHQIIQ